MAACLLQFTPLFKKIQEDFFINSAGFIRNASKSRSRGVRKANKGHKPPYGFKKQEKSNVNAGNILYHGSQLVYCPGLNVALGGYNKLYAKVAGKLYISSEKTNFKPGSAIVEKSFPLFIPPYQKYLNVIPEPLHKRFKLVEKF